VEEALEFEIGGSGGSPPLREVLRRKCIRAGAEAHYVQGRWFERISLATPSLKRLASGYAFECGGRKDVLERGAAWLLARGRFCQGPTYAADVAVFEMNAGVDCWRFLGTAVGRAGNAAANGLPKTSMSGSSFHSRCSRRGQPQMVWVHRR